MTHRQFLAWQIFLEEELDNPTKSENYLMQIALEVRRVLSRKPNEIKLSHFRLDYKKSKWGKMKPKDKKAEIKEHQEERLARSEGKVTRRYVDKDGNEVSPPPRANDES